MLFNVALLFASLLGYATLPELPDLEQAVKDVFSAISFDFLYDVYDLLNRFFEEINFIKAIGFDWNCGGALAMFAPVVLLFGSIVLIYMIAKDIFIRFSIKLSGTKKRNRSPVKGGQFLLYILQAVMVLMTNVIVSSWSIKRSCNAWDAELVSVGRGLSIFFILVFFWFAILVCGEIRVVTWRLVTVHAWLPLRNLLLITLGIWTPHLYEWVNIEGRAREYSRPAGDGSAIESSSPHGKRKGGNAGDEEEVMRLMGQSRPIVFTPIPGLSLLTKFAEAANSPPLFVPPEANMKTPQKRRAILWAANMVKYFCSVVFVFKGDVAALATGLVVTAGSAVYEQVASLKDDLTQR